MRTLFISLAGGIALPGLVLFVDTKRLEHEKVLRHELAHQRQMRIYSPFGMILIYFWCFGLLAVKKRLRDGRWSLFKDLWMAHPMEKEAIDAMGSHGRLPRIIRIGK